MSRERLPNRRPNETADLEFGSVRYASTIGYFPDGRPGEVFMHGSKVGSTMDGLLDDACILVSLLLQHNVDPSQLAASMERLGDETGGGIGVGVAAETRATTRVAEPVLETPYPLHRRAVLA